MLGINKLAQTLVGLVIREVELTKKSEELSHDFEVAQDCKNTPAIDSISEQYNELEEEIDTVHEAENLTLICLLDETQIDFYQN